MTNTCNAYKEYYISSSSSMYTDVGDRHTIAVISIKTRFNFSEFFEY